MTAVLTFIMFLQLIYKSKLFIISRNVVGHVLQCFSEVDDGETVPLEPDTNADRDYKLSEDKVCTYYAEIILSNTDQFNLKEFLKSWQLSVPEGMTTGLYQLEVRQASTLSMAHQYHFK